MEKYKHTKAAYKDESRLFYLAVSLFTIVLSTYMYFVSASVVHVVMRKEIDTQIGALATRVGEQEAEFIEMQHAVSSDIASLQGFVAADTKVFIDQTADTLVLSRN